MRKTVQTRGEKRKWVWRTFIFFPECSLSYPKNQQLVIVLPESSEELPIRIVRGSRSMELRLCLCPPDGEERHINETCPERGHDVAGLWNGDIQVPAHAVQGADKPQSVGISAKCRESECAAVWPVHDGLQQHYDTNTSRHEHTCIL